MAKVTQALVRQKQGLRTTLCYHRTYTYHYGKSIQARAPAKHSILGVRIWLLHTKNESVEPPEATERNRGEAKVLDLTRF